MNASQSGVGAYSQLVLDDTPGQSRVSLQRHATAHQGNDELNLGSLRHQTDNQRLDAAGFGAELKSDRAMALRAGKGMLLTSNVRNNASGVQLDSREAVSQIQTSMALQESMARRRSCTTPSSRTKRNRPSCPPSKAWPTPSPRWAPIPRAKRAKKTVADWAR
jgi:uncharacterized protein involved in type VI secretion and phage assembly